MAKENKAPQIENSEELTLESFAGLVRQMRHNQRRYRAFGRPEILETCKEYEKRVDAIIEKMFDPQLHLF